MLTLRFGLHKRKILESLIIWRFYLEECIPYPALKVIMIFQNHPTASSLRNKVDPQNFSFSRVSVEKGNG